MYEKPSYVFFFFFTKIIKYYAKQENREGSNDICINLHFDKDANKYYYKHSTLNKVDVIVFSNRTKVEEIRDIIV